MCNIYKTYQATSIFNTDCRMVFQLCLVSTVPHNSYVQTTSAFEALTGMKTPQPISTYTLVTKPHDVFKPKVEPGKVNQVEQYYLRCTTEWRDDGSEAFDIIKRVTRNSDNSVQARILFSEQDHERVWTMQLSEIPLGGKTQVSAQNIFESTMVHHQTKEKERRQNGTLKNEGSDVEILDVVKTNGNNQNETTDLENQSQSEVFTRRDSFLQFLSDLGYDVLNQYWIKGVRFFHGDIIIEIYKVLIRDDEDQSKSTNGHIKLKLLDESNTFQLKTFINVPKSTDINLINQGTKDLLHLQETLSSLITMEKPDRKYMDARVLDNK